MPDPKDGTAAAGTFKNEHTKKRGSVFVETGTGTVTSDADSGSKASHTSISPVASGTSATNTSPKKRRKVNHGQHDNPRVPPILCHQALTCNPEQLVSIVAVR
jgi:hypothetical protein